MVAAQDHGLDALEAACNEARVAVLNLLSQRNQGRTVEPVMLPDWLQLREDATADCARYGRLIRETCRGAP